MAGATQPPARLLQRSLANLAPDFDEISRDIHDNPAFGEIHTSLVTDIVAIEVNPDASRASHERGHRCP
jgi:hypothetical protein